MKVKLLIICLTALAIAPAMASATNSPEITHPTGTRLATATKITGTNIGDLRFYINGVVTTVCHISKLTGPLKKNGGGEVEISFETVDLEFCSPSAVTFGSGKGQPWCLRSTPTMNADEVQIRGGACTEAARPITFQTSGCGFERTTPLVGTFQTDTGTSNDATISVPNGAGSKFTSEVPCNATMEVQMSWTLETDSTLTEPLYFS